MKLFDFDKLIGTLTGYIETKIELLKIDVREGLTTAISKLVLFSAIALLGVFVLLFLFLGLSALLNDLLGSSYLGYLIVAGFFALALFIVLISREKIAADIREKLEEDQAEKDESDV